VEIQFFLKKKKNLERNGDENEEKVKEKPSYLCVSFKGL